VRKRGNDFRRVGRSESESHTQQVYDTAQCTPVNKKIPFRLVRARCIIIIIIAPASYVAAS
jgi:hypothetical protein